MRMPSTLRALVASASLLALPLAPASAGCPRSGGEQARRIVPSVLFWPAAPFILTHRPHTAPVPPAGAAVRVSRRDASGATQFVRGTLVSLDSAAVTVATAGNVAERIPMVEVRCVQVPRRSRAAGAATGFSVGALTGIGAAGIVALTDNDPKLDREEAFALGSFIFGALGSIGGTLIGTAVRATSWDTVLDRTR